MFNSHNLPDSILNAVGNILENTNSDFDLPPVLQEAVADAAADYLRCPTQEDRKAIVEWHAEQVVDIKELESQTLVNFARAVEYVANGGLFQQTITETKKVQGTRVPGGFQELTSSGTKANTTPRGKRRTPAEKERVAVGKKEHQERKTREAVNFFANRNREAAEAGTRRAASMGQPVGGYPELQMQSVQYLMDVLASLNESEFDAYLDLLSESEIQLLEQIINENN